MMRRPSNVVIALLAMVVPVFGFLQTGLRPAPRRSEEHAVGEQLAFIVNVSNSIDKVSREELRRIFLGERSHWGDGGRITLVMMGSDRPERKAMLRELCQMNETDYDNRILHGLFTGELFVSPKTLATPTGVRKFVFNVPGAIGYVRATDVDETVKVLRIDGRLPADRDYPFHIDQHPK